MAKFFEYNSFQVARIYDSLRLPQGADVIAGILQVRCGKPLKDIHLLDAGCGAGTYAKSLIEMGVGKMTLLDGSAEMLQVAKEKLDDEFKTNIVDAFVEAKFPSFPFRDETFDAVMFNQSLHHVDALRDGQNYPNLERTLKDDRRIMKTDGILIISTGLASTIRESVWFLQLQHGIREKVAKSVMTADQYNFLFEKHGFQCVTGLNLLTTGGSNILANFLQPESVLDVE